MTRIAPLAALLALGLTNIAGAAFTIEAAVGGAPAGAVYTSFDDLPLGPSGGTSNGIAVSFTGDGQAVQGAASSLYAAPFLSNSNGVPFGDPTNGADATTYLSTGVGSVTLDFGGPQNYLGLLWGSVDAYNSLSFYDGSNSLIGTITGGQITDPASGNQGISGTYYVNITSDVAFSRVVATSGSYAFEFDNVTTAAVPEPSSVVMCGIAGIAGLFTARRKMKRAI
jgi:hypothetical protein